jgi:hypothetical protein
MPIQIRILPQVLKLLENLIKKKIIHSNAIYIVFIFLVSIISVITFNILDIILKFSGKSIVYRTFTFG